jgi:hypothetical protein
MEAGISEHAWSIAEIASLVEERVQLAARSKCYNSVEAYQITAGLNTSGT